MGGSASVPVPKLGRDLALTGRAETLDFLQREVLRAATGRFRVILISGSGGVGKTRLIAEVLDRNSNDFIRMTARSFRWGDTTSFGPWVEAVDRHLRGRPAEEVRQLGGPAIDDLAAIVPSAKMAAERPPGEPNRAQLLDALSQVLDRLSGEAPVLLAFDDIHLADSSAWEALRYIGRRLGDAPIAVLASARGAGLRSRPIISEVLLGLEDDDLLTRVDLQPLGRADIATLAHAVLQSDPRQTSTFVPEPLVSWLMSRSLGYPLFVIGLLRALVEEGADLSNPKLERTPHRISERIALDLHGLDPMAKELLELLAVLDQRIDISSLALLANRSITDLGTALEDLTRGHLVAEHGEGSDLLYEIVHPIVEDVIYEEIGTARRSALHDRIAHFMLDADRLGAAASHFARAASSKSDEAIDALFRAMEQASQRDLYQEALAVMGTLLEVLPEGDPRWLRVLDSVTVNSQWVLSHLAETDAGTAIAAMKRVIEVAEHTEDLSSRAKARFHLASFLSFGEGQATEAETACREAVELFAQAGDVESELLGRNELAWIEALKGDFAASAKMAEQVWALAKRDGRVDVAAVAAGTAAFSTGVIGDCPKARRLFEEAVELAQESGSSYRVAWAHSLGPHVSMAACGHLGTAVAWCEQALADDPAAPDALAFENLGLAYWLGGRMDEALTVLERSPVRRPIVGSRRRAWGSALAARLYGERGELRRGVSSLERASATYDSQFLVFGAWVGWADGMLAWFDGRHEDAIAHLEHVAEWLRATGALVYEPLVMADLAEVASEAGKRLVCQEVAERAVEISRHRECKLARWVSHYTTAHLHLVRGETEEAAKAATEALAGFEAGDYLLLAAGARRVLGEALGAGDRAASAASLEEAARAYDRQGAVWRRDRTLDLLASLGAEGRRAARAVQGPESLTPREREVAELTMRGHTAREVGERLFIGNRTVETHLANIYAKLGVGSKRELIQMSRELDLG